MSLILTLALLLPAPQEAKGPPDSNPIERFRTLEFSPKPENFDKGWKERVAAEFELVNSAPLDGLRTALKDSDVFVRAMAARVLGIRGDKASADELATLAEADPDYRVRTRAIESLGLLKMKPEILERAKKDKGPGVPWVAAQAAGQCRRDVDYAALMREAYAEGIRREEMDTAKVGQPAPDFSARTTDGKVFKLSEVLGKKPIAIYFAAFDG